MKFKTWVLRYILSLRYVFSLFLFFSLSLSLSLLSLSPLLSPHIVSRKSTVQRTDSHNCTHLKEIFTFVSHKRDGCLFKVRTQSQREPTLKSLCQVFNYTDPLFTQ